MKASPKSFILDQMQPPRRTLLSLVASALLLSALGTAALADSPSPIGYWITIDDDGKTRQSIVQIEAEGQTLSGKLVHIFDEAHRGDRCEKCDGPLKNAPILGLRFMWNLRRDGSEWSGGSVLDPQSGKTYRCFIEPLDGGKRLKVRGYLGLSLLGRTQYWIRTKGPTG